MSLRVIKQQARIVKGTEVPYQQAAGQGATSTSFKEVALTLDVTSFIDETGVRLDIKLAKDEPDFGNALNSIPPIKTVSLASADSFHYSNVGSSC